MLERQEKLDTVPPKKHQPHGPACGWAADVLGLEAASFYTEAIETGPGGAMGWPCLEQVSQGCLCVQKSSL